MNKNVSSLLVVSVMAVLTGCASLESRQAKGDAIIIARLDTRFDGGSGRLVTDNASGMPSMAANAAGANLGAGGGAATDVGVGALINIVGGALLADRIPIRFKLLYEKGCEFSWVEIDLRKSPDSQKLYPGYKARWVAGVDGDSVGMLIPALDAKGQQTYLTKPHPCYPTWVDEWKNHQKAGWHGRWALGGTPKEQMPDPDIEWVK